MIAGQNSGEEFETAGLAKSAPDRGSGDGEDRQQQSFHQVAERHQGSFHDIG